MSAFVALTLSPMMCRLLLKHKEKPGFFYRVTEPFFVGMTALYTGSLALFMRARWLTFPIMAAISAYVVLVWPTLPRELAPLEDRSNIRVSARAPDSAGFDYTSSELDKVGAWVVENVPEIHRTYSISAMGGGQVNSGVQNIYLKPPAERTRSQAEIFQQVSAGLSKIDGLRIFPAQPPTIGSRSSGQPLQYVLQAPSAEVLLDVLPAFLETAQKRPELAFVDVDFKVNREETVVEVNREKAAELGVSAEQVARTLQFTFGDQRLGYYVMNGKQYQVIGQLDRSFRNEPEDLRSLFTKNVRGEMIPLDNLVTWREHTVPSAVYRYDRYVAATVSAGLSPGFALGDGISAMDTVAREVLPQTVVTKLAGEARDFSESSDSLLFAFILALLVIYLVLAAQFESFIDPLIILLAVPMSLIGAVIALQLTGSSLNIFSQIGIIMLIGLVTKNGILIVEFANQRREQGLSVREAVLEAAKTRFRPILMTSLATILGVLPIALSLGAAAGSRQSLGIAVVGGLLGATFLSLYLVPALYTFISREMKPTAAGPSEPAQNMVYQSPLAYSPGGPESK